MGAAIPRKIKDKVLTLYVHGRTRKKIAKELKISTGSVSNIMTEFQQEVPNLDLARSMGKLIQAEGWNMIELSSAMHFKKHLDCMAVSEEQIEELIEYAEAYCFQMGVSIEEFVKSLFFVCDVSEALDVPLNQLPKHLTRLQEKVEEKQKAISALKRKIDAFHQLYQTTPKELEQYKRDRPLLEKIHELKLIIHNMERASTKSEWMWQSRSHEYEDELQECKAKYEWANYDWGTPEGIIERIRTKDGKPLEHEEVYSAAKSLLNSPGNYVAVILSLIRRHRYLSREK